LPAKSRTAVLSWIAHRATCKRNKHAALLACHAEIGSAANPPESQGLSRSWRPADARRGSRHRLWNPAKSTLESGQISAKRTPISPKVTGNLAETTSDCAETHTNFAEMDLIFAEVHTRPLPAPIQLAAIQLNT
jgi:hypothetical protein